MQIELTIEYFTRWGENLFLVSAGKRFSMFYTSDGVWAIGVDTKLLHCKDSMLHFHFEVEQNGAVVRSEWRCHSLPLSSLFKGISLRMAWSEAPQLAYCTFLSSLFHCDSESSPRFAGTAVPLFSLRSETDFGCGEFRDLKLLVNWAVATGQRVIQLLPVNDTSSGLELNEICPYNAVSAFALHPIFINLEDAGLPKALYGEIRQVCRKLNSEPAVNYGEVFRWKIQMLEEIFKARWKDVHASRKFKDFCSSNSYWLEDYARMQAQRREYSNEMSEQACNGINASSANTEQAGNGVNASSVMTEQAGSEISEYDIHFFRFVQFIAHCQFMDAVEYAHSKGVVFKGDLPIGVSRNSADVLAHPELFNLSVQAGAPPDAFSQTGQMWGFPTYNWKAMEAENFRWWRERLRHMSQYFSLYRIDHILGFFRIWEVPLDAADGTEGRFNPALALSENDIDALFNTPSGLSARPGKAVPSSRPFTKSVKEKLVGKLFIEENGGWHPRICSDIEKKIAALEKESGLKQLLQRYRSLYNSYFYGRNDFFWKQQAIERLPALLDASSMVACGEDLGMIPSTVPEVMGQLNILSLEVQRMPKKSGGLFAQTKDYPYMSVCTTGTHDMSTLRGWWVENPELTQRFYNEELHLEGEAPAFLTRSIASQIIRMHLESPSALAIFPLQDWMALVTPATNEAGLPASATHADACFERINNPADTTFSWRYRMPVTLEKLAGNEELTAGIRRMISDSGRLVGYGDISRVIE